MNKLLLLLCLPVILLLQSCASPPPIHVAVLCLPPPQVPQEIRESVTTAQPLMPRYDALILEFRKLLEAAIRN